MPTMKLLLGHCFYRSSSPSGEDAVYKNEKKLLMEKGITVIPYEKQNDHLEGMGLLGKMGSGLEYCWSKKSYREVSRIIESERPDIAHFHNIFPQMSTSVYKACYDHGIPVIQTLHNFRYMCPNALFLRERKPCEDCISKTLLSSIQHKCYRNSYLASLPMAGMIYFNRLHNNFNRYVTQYICLTEFAKNQFIKGGFLSEKLCVKPNFISDHTFESIQNGDYVLFVGRLSEEKGLLTLLEAAKNIRDIPILIAGDGPLRAKLESTTITHNLNIQFLGYLPKDSVMQTIAKSRFVVLPSECYEGFPVTIAEAFSCYKPVIASDLGGPGEIIKDGITGFKFTPGSAESLANTIANLWNNLPLLKELSLNCRWEYEEKFSEDNNFQILMSIYKRSIQEPLQYQYKNG
jgi:glycosyltransferase involved in cell wall biosynthesis